MNNEDSMAQYLNSNGIAFASSADGHRQHYIDLLGSLFNLEPLCKAFGPKLFVKLLQTNKLVLATFDDNILLGVCLSFARAILGKNTTSIVLRPSSCFIDEGASLTARLRGKLKFLCCSFINKFSRINLISIVSADFDPRFRKIARYFLIDPQFWDMHDGTILREPQKSPLSDEILKIANGRQIVSIFGTLTPIRGYDFLADIMAKNPKLSDQILAVAAGKSLPGCEKINEKFENSGGLLIDRHLTDQEIESLYLASHLVWACYAPHYDISSGIFGRAMQFDVQAIIRKDSFLEHFAKKNSLSPKTLAYGDLNAGTIALEKCSAQSQLMNKSKVERTMMIGRWRNHFITTMSGTLDGSNGSTSVAEET